MSSISGVSGSSDAWAVVSTQRSAHQAKMFAKVDTDGNGSVNQAELDTMLSDVSQKTGTTLGDGQALFTQMDSDADGNLTSDELQQGMKQILPPPSTVDFAQAAGGPKGPRGPGGPGGAGGAPAADTASYDALDINKDGTVSELERLAGALKELAATDPGDGSSTAAQSEIAKLAQKLYDQISANFLEETSDASLNAAA